MRNLQVFCSLIFCSLLFTQVTLKAQDDGPYFVVFDYMKVAPGMSEDYLKLENAWKKIHQTRIDAGSLDGWSLHQVVMPSGAQGEYNYVTVNGYAGRKQLAGHFSADGPMPDDLSKILSPEELALVNLTSTIRDMIKTEVWQVRDMAEESSGANAMVSVFNYFKLKPGVLGREHGKMEAEVWKPVHEAKIKNGEMAGWAMASLFMPYGSEVPYSNATVDWYTDMEQMIMPASDGLFEKVHPGKNADDMYAKTRELADLLRAEVRYRIDRIGFN